jgi:uncharacterized protein (TIGR02757 family)
MKAADQRKQLKTLLDKVLIDFPPTARIDADPVQFPRWYFEQGRSLAEIEAVALISAMLAYGSASQFIKKLREIMKATDWQFLKAINSGRLETWPAYRLSTSKEIQTLAKAGAIVIKENGSLKSVFLKGYAKNNEIKDGLIALHDSLTNACLQLNPELTRGLRHLLPNPSSGGCVKRWHMFLRWLVRKNDGVDMNLWPEVAARHLLIPLDRHISRISRNLGLTSRKTDDWKTAAEISASLRNFDADDPVKYDFSLCHLGISGKCTHGKDLKLCKKCILGPACAALKAAVNKT